MYKLIRALLFNFDPEKVHSFALSFVRLAGKKPFGPMVSSAYKVDSPMLEQKVFGLDFKNPVGAAAGFDKPAVALEGLEAIGFGFVEVGTVTFKPQDGNPKPRLFRLPEDWALINRMGFNSLGSEVLKKQLASYKNLTMPVGISLGKNKVVPLEQAAQDYLDCFKALYNSANYFVVNVSSPNTPGLRELQDKSFLVEIFSALNNYRTSQTEQKPLLVKIAPDLTFEAINEVLEVCKQHNVAGIIATNTSISREGLKSQINEVGGLSGKPVKTKATQIIRHIHKHSPGLPIIGVGGIFTAQDAYEKIKAGASLVQIYTGFIYQGPSIVKKINKGLLELIKRDGFKNISEAVGVESQR